MREAEPPRREAAVKSRISRVAFQRFQRVLGSSKRTTRPDTSSHLGQRGRIPGALLMLFAAGCGGSDSDGGSPSADVNLAVLEITGVELDQEFDPELLNYTASVRWLT